MLIFIYFASAMLLYDYLFLRLALLLVDMGVIVLMCLTHNNKYLWFINDIVYNVHKYIFFPNVFPIYIFMFTFMNTSFATYSTRTNDSFKYIVPLREAYERNIQPSLGSNVVRKVCYLFSCIY